ncbi:unnamed protein product [Ilex paraguariensis]|uniref:Uncharacterized protein n=1 Tax=Ilex paraguariensis TaxID=185542 RepID=A0ABC8RWD0_9AQUA
MLNEGHATKSTTKKLQELPKQDVKGKKVVQKQQINGQRIDFKQKRGGIKNNEGQDLKNNGAELIRRDSAAPAANFQKGNDSGKDDNNFGQMIQKIRGKELYKPSGYGGWWG